jgi:hypothetical protein
MCCLAEVQKRHTSFSYPQPHLLLLKLLPDKTHTTLVGLEPTGWLLQGVAAADADGWMQLDCGWHA